MCGGDLMQNYACTLIAWYIQLFRVENRKRIEMFYILIWQLKLSVSLLGLVFRKHKKQNTHCIILNPVWELENYLSSQIKNWYLYGYWLKTYYHQALIKLITFCKTLIDNMIVCVCLTIKMFADKHPHTHTVSFRRHPLYWRCHHQTFHLAILL